MGSLPIYLDNHATTRVDPRVVAAMQPYWTELYGNAGSTSHVYGAKAKEAVDQARQGIADAIGGDAEEVVFTSGATESNNLALRGVMARRAAKGKHLVSVQTEHRAVLDPLRRLEREGFEVTRLGVMSQATGASCGRIDLDDLRQALRADTQLVSVMLANNEIGVIERLGAIAEICRDRGVLLHSDATQAVGKLPINLRDLPLDLVSFSAHKLHGPKGIGALFVRRRRPSIRITPQIEGGGQERGRRSGTLPIPLIVGFCRALQLAVDEMFEEMPRQARLRGQLWQGLQHAIPNCRLNGPPLDAAPLPDPLRDLGRLPNNLNVQFPGLDGEALMLNSPEVAVSSGSACSSADPEPSHVLRSIGLEPDAVRSSLRFGLSRFTTSEEVDAAVESLAAGAKRLRELATD